MWKNIHSVLWPEKTPANSYRREKACMWKMWKIIHKGRSPKTSPVNPQGNFYMIIQRFCVLFSHNIKSRHSVNYCCFYFPCGCSWWERHCKIYTVIGRGVRTFLSMYCWEPLISVLLSFVSSKPFSDWKSSENLQKGKVFFSKILSHCNVIYRKFPKWF